MPQYRPLVYFETICFFFLYLYFFNNLFFSYPT
jgi:hypothetical protein